MLRKSQRVGTWTLWTITVLAAIGMGNAGFGKLFTTGQWDRLFQSWGYPIWFMFLIGCIELFGALALFVRRTAATAAFLLAAVMLGAVGTLITHPGSHFFGARPTPMKLTGPLVLFALLATIGVARWRQMRARAPSTAQH